MGNPCWTATLQRSSASTCCRAHARDYGPENSRTESRETQPDRGDTKDTVKKNVSICDIRYRSNVRDKYLFFFLFFLQKLMVLFSKDVLNLAKITVKMLQNKCCFFNIIMVATKILSTLVFLTFI